MKKIAIIIYGPPGSGKGTQAELLAKATDIVHFDIGAHLEKIVHDPANKNNREIQKHRRVFDSGGIIDPLWVAKIAETKIREISRSGFSIVLSGSLRTTKEAFGEGAKHGLFDVFEEEYGRKNIFLFLLKADSDISVKRNSARFICSYCNHSVLSQYVGSVPKVCPVCAGILRKRTLDNPAVIAKRLEAYKAQTMPVFPELKKRGYKLKEIKGEAPPYLVNKEILKNLKLA